MSKLCGVCEQRVASWAWQAFGPAETPDCFTLLGSFYRGFPVVPVCSFCKEAFHNGVTLVFEAARTRHIAIAKRVYPANTFQDGLYLARVVADKIRDTWHAMDTPDWHGGVEAAKEIEREIALITALLPMKKEAAHDSIVTGKSNHYRQS